MCLFNPDAISKPSPQPGTRQGNLLLVVELDELVLWLLLGVAAGADTDRALEGKGGREAGVGKETLVASCRPHL